MNKPEPRKQNGQRQFAVYNSRDHEAVIELLLESLLYHSEGSLTVTRELPITQRTILQKALTKYQKEYPEIPCEIVFDPRIDTDEQI